MNSVEQEDIKKEQTQTKQKLGFGLRFVEAYNVIVLVLGIAYAIVSDGYKFAYDFSFVYIFVQMATAVRCIWLIEKRASIARRFIVIATLVCLCLSIVDMFWGHVAVSLQIFIGNIGIGMLVAGHVVCSLTVCLVVLFSKKTKTVFTYKEMPWKEYRARRKEDIASQRTAKEHVLNIRPQKTFSWLWIRNTILYYCIFSLLGHWAEILFCQLIAAGIFMGEYDITNFMLWNLILYPFPAEGIAMVLIAVILYPFKYWLQAKVNGRIVPTLIITALITSILCVGIDFVTGILANADYSLWDYRDMPFNFMGQICLQNSLVYCIAAVLILWVFYPVFECFLRWLPKNIADGFFFGFVGAYMFLECLYFVNIGPNGLVFG